MSTARVSVSPAEVSRFAFQVFTGTARDHGIELPSVVPASRLAEQPTPATVLTGIAELDALTGGVPRGALTEICGLASSGRTSVLLALLAAMTAQAEVCALVDVTDSFDPQSAAAAGVNLQRLLWVRCSKKTSTADGRWSMASSELRVASCERKTISAIDDRQSTARSMRFVAAGHRPSTIDRLAQALKAADLLLQGGGFGLVIVDLADVPPQAARRIPLTSWFRFRRAVENTRTVLLVLEQEPYAKTCASLVCKLSAVSSQLSAARQVSGSIHEQQQPSQARILSGLNVTAEVLRCGMQKKKPIQSVHSQWESKTAWTG